jgi:hypothetical protein
MVNLNSGTGTGGPAVGPAEGYEVGHSFPGK